MMSSLLPITFQCQNNFGSIIWFEGGVEFTSDFGPWRRGDKMYAIKLNIADSTVAAYQWNGGNPLVEGKTIKVELAACE